MSNEQRPGVTDGMKGRRTSRRSIELRPPTLEGGRRELCLALAAILARVCAEPDTVQWAQSGTSNQAAD